MPHPAVWAPIYPPDGTRSTPIPPPPIPPRPVSHASYFPLPPSFPHPIWSVPEAPPVHLSCRGR
ncbi:hypothetical protein P691DRAFT_807760 [Macrolepiota fuliginosa MF-IS2]|uniref:Uncharacterized protein n=1 Tax=Macrolepiota fuliginosa MF-IS2 TaxID=1400762 RepID=A0A9P5X7F7_9AGAR|nr:hypothetical protein P691DRAFT_807760 [Macrolepiota fuliginosa MF-IS2]